MDLVTLALAKSYVDKRVNEEGGVTGATPQQVAQIEQNKSNIATLQTEIDNKQPKGNYVKTINGNAPDVNGNVSVEFNNTNSSGGNPWRCIANMELTEEVKLLEFTEDVDGNPFAVTEIIYGLYVLPNAEATTSSRIVLTGVQPLSDGVPATGYRCMEARAVYARGVAFTEYLRLGTNYANKLDPTEAYSTLVSKLAQNTIALTDEAACKTISVNFVVNAGIGTKIIIFAR